MELAFPEAFGSVYQEQVKTHIQNCPVQHGQTEAARFVWH